MSDSLSTIPGVSVVEHPLIRVKLTQLRDATTTSREFRSRLTELATLLNTLKTLRVDGVANEDLQRDLSAAEADLILRIQSFTGDVTLALVTLQNAFFIHSSEYPLFFTLSAHEFNRLMQIDIHLISGEESTR